MYFYKILMQIWEYDNVMYLVVCQVDGGTASTTQESYYMKSSFELSRHGIFHFVDLVGFGE